MRTIAFVLALASAGCWFSISPSPHVPTTEERLEKCRDESRAVYYADGGALEGAEAAYERCVVREGVQ